MEAQMLKAWNEASEADARQNRLLAAILSPKTDFRRRKPRATSPAWLRPIPARAPISPPMPHRRQVVTVTTMAGRAGLPQREWATRLELETT